MLVSALVNIVIIIVVGAVIGGIVNYAPFIPQPFKQWLLYIIGALVVLLVVLAIIPLFTGAAAVATAPAG